MDHKHYGDDLKDLRRQIRIARMHIAALLLLLTVSGITVFKLAGSERVVLVPPTIERTFWVENGVVDTEYLHQMAGFVAWLTLDVTPASIDWKTKTLRNWADPLEYGALEERQNLESTRLKRMNGATYFAVRSLEADPKRLTVRLVGQLHTMVNGVETSARQTRFVVTFAFRSGRLHLKSLKEEVNES